MPAVADPCASTARGASQVILSTRAVRGAGCQRGVSVRQRSAICDQPHRRLRAHQHDPPPSAVRLIHTYLARIARGGPGCSVTVAPSQWRRSAQAASAWLEARQDGHGGWPTGEAMQDGADGCATWLGDHLEALEAAIARVERHADARRGARHARALTCLRARLCARVGARMAPRMATRLPPVLRCPGEGRRAPPARATRPPRRARRLDPPRGTSSFLLPAAESRGLDVTAAVASRCWTPHARRAS